jgi:quinol monooxygenase YgiN
MNASARLVATIAASISLAVGMMAQARAEDPATIYVVSYVEVQPSAKDQGVALVKSLRDAARKDAGNMRAEALQRASRPGQFVLLTAWKDQGALDAHMAAAATKEAREKIKALRVSPQDDRIHTALSVGTIAAPAARGLYVVTHVDVIPPRKDDAVGLLKTLGEASRKEDGNLRYEVVQQVNRPNHFSVIEIWRDDKAFDAHSMAGHVREFRDQVAPMSGALYDQRLYHALD